MVGDPLWTVIIVTATNALAFGPTIRKSYQKPEEETFSAYLLGAVKWALACTALYSLSISTLLFPASSLLFNGALTARVGAAAVDVCRPLPFISAPPVRARDMLAEAFRRNAGSPSDAS